MMKRKKGFTLTEVLLAVLVVALIGVALASLTTAASREGGVGRSKVMLRNHMSRSIRQLRRDVNEASRIIFARGQIPLNTINGSTPISLLLLGRNLRLDGTAIPGMTPQYILYCFVPGTQTTTANGSGVVPANAKDGGIIYRTVLSDANNDGTPDGLTFESDSNHAPICTSSLMTEVLLDNVKFIPPSATAEDNYPVPLFAARGFSGIYSANTSTTLVGQLIVNFILELNSSPVVNDVAAEEFVLPTGYMDNRPATT